MFDELERLCDAPVLLQLLAHYAEAGAADREAWQDRLMALDGVMPADLVKLHGELIAYGCLEQNTGSTPVLKPGGVACSYRITTAGQRALQWARAEQPADAESDAAAA